MWSGYAYPSVTFGRTKRISIAKLAKARVTSSSSMIRALLRSSAAWKITCRSAGQRTSYSNSKTITNLVAQYLVGFSLGRRDGKRSVADLSPELRPTLPTEM